jgi:hypothetical protein
MNYDPNSTDSMLSRILERMQAQDDKLQTILDQCVKTNGRVSKLEVWRDQLHGNITVVAGVFSAAVSAITAWVIKRN